MPLHADFPVPNYLDFAMTVKNTWDGGPDGIIPFDMGGAKLLRERFLDDMTSAEERFKESEARSRRALEKARQEVKDELEDRRQQLEKAVQPLLDKMTPRDWIEQLMAHGGRRKAPRAYAFHGRSG